MSKFEDHCLVTEKEFGQDYAHVHKWLDELFVEGKDHRQYRHHEKAVRERFSDLTELRVAEKHIFDDLGGIPVDQNDYLFGDFTSWRQL